VEHCPAHNLLRGATCRDVMAMAMLAASCLPWWAVRLFWFLGDGPISEASWWFGFVKDWLVDDQRRFRAVAGGLLRALLGTLFYFLDVVPLL